MISICEHTGLKVLQKKEWIFYSKTSNMSGEVKIIDDNILLLKAQGNITTKDFLDGEELGDSIINTYFKNKEYFLIYDLSNLLIINLKIRQYFINWLLKNIDKMQKVIFFNAHFITKSYIISNKFFSSKLSKIEIADSYTEAINKILDLKKNNIFNLQKSIIDKANNHAFNFEINLIEKNIFEIIILDNFNNSTINNIVELFYIIQSEVEQKVFLIINFKKVKSIDIDNENLDYLYLNLEISIFNIPNEDYIETIDKISKIFKVNFFNDKKTAIDFFTEKTFVEQKEIINPYFKKLWLKNKNYFFLRDNKYPALKPRSWVGSIRDNAVNHYTFLVDENIYYRHISGYLEKDDMSELISSFDDILNESKPKDMKYYLIMDYNDLKGTNLQNRKAGVKWFEKISDDTNYIVFCNLNYIIKIFVKHGKSISNKFNNVSITETVEDAFDFILDLKYKRTNINTTNNNKKTSPKIKKTKKQIIKELRDENYKLKSDMFENIEKLKDFFSKITWEENIEQINFEYKNNNPFSELFLSTYILQKEINEIIQNKEDLVKQAEKSEKLKTAFLANMSHEIRTPLNAILGFTEILQSQESNSSNERYFNIINKNGEQLLNLINQIIDYSRISSGDIAINYSTFELNELIKEIISSFLIKDLNIDLIFENKNNDFLYIKSDKIRLKQVIVNLISNAIKFTNNGYIKISYKIDNSKIYFTVEDTGIGISNENLKLIFNRFQQANKKIETKYGGSGLGLAISKEIVNLLGGDIYAKSEVNKGSNFYFSIEYIKQEKKNIEKIEKFKVTDLSNKSILVVDDNFDNLFFIKEILLKLNINIFTANNGKDALEISKTVNLDWILMDIMLPDVNGLELSKEIFKSNPNIKIIIQSAYTIDNEIEYAKDFNCVDFLTKPIKKDVLLKAVKNQFN